jgi:predicted deacylase
MRRPASIALLLLPACVCFHPRTPPAAAPAAEPVAAAAVAPATPPRPREPTLTWREIGLSVQRRPLRAATLGEGPRRVLWIGGVHGNEREGRVATTELPAALLTQPGALQQVTLTIVEDGNPDGTAMNIRYNANAVDLNRNYPASNFKSQRAHGTTPLSQPEARTLYDLIKSVKPHLVIVAHSCGDSHYINFDGPAEAVASRFATLSGYPLKFSREIHATPGSLGSWVGSDLGIPILTLEYARGREPHEAWEETRAAILAAILPS